MQDLKKNFDTEADKRNYNQEQNKTLLNVQFGKEITCT